ncbi:MAG: hypothetical protein AB7G75_28450 [Candidatus Binatia bacterium]
MGDRLSLRTRYNFPYSTRVTFDFDECFGRVGTSRIGGQNDVRQGAGLGGSGGFGSGSSASVTSGFGGFGGFGSDGLRSCSGSGGLGSLGRGDPGSILSSSELVTRGETIENDFNFRNRINFSQNFSVASGYQWRYLGFLDEGGQESAHSFDIDASYTRWRGHRLYARYRLTLFRRRTGGSETIHDVDVGDDYFGSRQIQLTPTLSIFASTGISTATGGGKFRLRHKLDVSLVKLWRTAVFTVGVDRGLSSSVGVSGPSFTTNFFSTYVIQLSRRFTGIAAADFSMFDTDDSDFQTLQILAGLQYWVTSWMSVNLMYNYRWLDPDQGGSRDNFLSTAKIDGHSVIVSLSAYFDIWPNVGLARGIAARSPFLSSPVGGGSQSAPSSPGPASGGTPLVR